MPLPPLDHWIDTAQGLHRGALLLGAAQRLTQPPRAAYLELGLVPARQGLETGRLPSGGRLRLDLAGSRIVYTSPEGLERSYNLPGRTQALVFEELFGLLAQDELASFLPPGEDLFERLAAGVASKGNRYRPLRRESLLDPSPLRIDRQAAEDYSAALEEIFTGIARFRASLEGLVTPLVVWPEHFDLAGLWFAGCEIDESYPHISLGFAPYSEGIEEAYLYAYAYPYPDTYDPPALPPGARWHTTGWTGMVLPYRVIASQAEPVRFVEEACATIFAGLRRLLESK